MPEKELNYMGIEPDRTFSCVASATMPKRELAKELANWIRQGLSIGRCSDEFVRSNFGKIIGDVKSTQ